MITPRTTRLLRAPDLHVFRDIVVSLACEGAPLDARDRLVVVPTHAAGAHLTRSIERRLTAEAPVRILPDLVTAAELTARLASRLPPAPVLSDVEREVLLGAACRAAAESGDPPPFRLRPALIAEILRFHDALRRQQRDVDAFERLALGALEPGAAIDRGAARLALQTRFLVSAFRRFEQLCAGTGASDEPRLRSRVIAEEAVRPWRHAVVAVGDHAADARGLWPADWDVLARIPGLARLDVVVTDTMLAGAFHERIHQLLPGIEEVTVAADDARVPPVLVTPPGSAGMGPAHTVRDREEEIVWFARWIRQTARAGGPLALDRAALVVRRPLPYVYLAREVLGSASIECQMFDALPLAAEPFAAVLDLVVTFASTGFSRQAAVALLRSPHIETGGVSPKDISALDRALSDAGYLGGYDTLCAWHDGVAADAGPRTARAARAGAVMRRFAEALLPLRDAAPASEHLTLISTFLQAHGRAPAHDDPLLARQLRARAAVLGILSTMAAAHARWDPAMPSSLEDVAAAVRRRIEGHTFAPRTGEAGVHLVDTDSARFGDFDLIQIAGLVDGEWPAPPRRNIFYSPAILRDLGWPAEADRLAGERAVFIDLLRLPSARLALTQFTLEDEALVAPSPLLDAVDEAGLASAPVSADPTWIFDFEALGAGVPTAGGLSGLPPRVAAAARHRLSRISWGDARFHGGTSGHRPASYSVGALERYQDCPFKFFAADVLRLEEPPDDAPFSPRLRGAFIHQVFQRFFEEWHQRHGGAVTSDRLDEARALCEEVCTPLLASLPDAEAAIERTRLFGSAIAMGMVDVVLGIEAAGSAQVVERWLEHRFEGEFALGAPERRVSLRGIADRIDVLEGRRLRVIDYKSGSASNARRALQVPIYALCASETLAARDGGHWTVDEAAYVAFGARRPLVPVVRPGGDEAERTLGEARERLFEAVDGVTAGRFPPRPHDPILCTYCAYPSVCRKDYVGDE